MNRGRDKIIIEAWKQAKRGKSFKLALEAHGYRLASGYTGVVVIDSRGKVFNPTKHLVGVNAKAVRRMVGNECDRLPDATLLSKQIKDGRLQTAGSQTNQQERTTQLLNRLQKHQLEERAIIFNNMQTRFEKETDRLAGYYRIKEQQEEIKKVETRKSKPSWWERMRGANTMDETDLTRLRDELKAATQTLAGRLGVLEAERDQAISDLTEQHQKERKVLMMTGEDGTLNHTIPNRARIQPESNINDRDFER